MISKLVFIPFWIYSSYLSAKFRALHPELDSNFNLFHSILYYAFQILIIVVSFRIIKYLNSDRELDFSEKIYGEHVSKIYVVATKEQRFFNYLIDTLIWFIVYASLFNAVKSLVTIYLEMDSTVLNNDSMAHHFENDSSKDLIAFSYLLLFRFVYYLFFELVFKSSPAKFLTETRVMDSVGEPTNLKEVFLRTFYRNIPLNPVTFLFGYNLHDNWSATEVFQEKRVGVSGNKYLGYFFTMIIFFVILYFGVNFYDKHQKENYKLQVYEQKINQNKQDISNLVIGDIIIIHHYSSNDSGQYILKVSNIIGDKIYFNKIDSNVYNQPDEEVIIRNKDKYFLNELDTFHVNRKDLLKAIITADERLKIENYQVNNPEGFGFKLLKDNKNYFIINVIALGRPILKIEKAGSSELGHKFTELTFRISNLGISSKLIAVKSNQDDVLWSVENSVIPVQIPNFSGNYSNESVLNIKGKGDNIKDPDFTISIQDSLGKKYKYQILSNNDNSDVIIKPL
ncbi:MAG: RDD family protein [Bacteroidota bacterium]